MNDQINDWESFFSRLSHFLLLDRRISVPFPVFIFQILSILALAVIFGIFVSKNALIEKKFEWYPPPLILVPGLRCNRLYLEGFGIEYSDEGLRAKCPKNIAFRSIWTSKRLFEESECELPILSLSYNASSATFHDISGVQISANLREIPFGESLVPLEPLDCYESNNYDNCYMKKLEIFLSDKLKYQIGQTLFAAPYDWRQHLDSEVLNEYYAKLKVLIEHAVNKTGKKAMILAHSMGSNLVNWFLSKKVPKVSENDNVRAKWKFQKKLKFLDNQWQQTYLGATINVGAPFGGASCVLKDFFSSKPFRTINSREMTKFFRSFGCSANVLPFSNAFSADEWLIQIGTQKFGISKMRTFLSMSNLSHLWPFYAKFEPQPQQHIPMYCVYGIGQNNTGRQYIFKALDDPNFRTIFGDGDGTVNVESLRMCRKWEEKGMGKISVKEFAWPGKSHVAILTSTDFFKHISEILSKF